MKHGPLAVYSSVATKISLAVQTVSRFKVFHLVGLHAAPVVLSVCGGGGGGDGKRVGRASSSVLRHSVVDEGQPARTFVPHPAAVSLHPGVGRHLHLHLLLLVLLVRLRRCTGRRAGRIKRTVRAGPYKDNDIY